MGAALFLSVFGQMAWSEVRFSAECCTVRLWSMSLLPLSEVLMLFLKVMFKVQEDMSMACPHSFFHGSVCLPACCHPIPLLLLSYLSVSWMNNTKGGYPLALAKPCFAYLHSSYRINQPQETSEKGWKSVCNSEYLVSLCLVFPSFQIFISTVLT